MKEAIQPKYQKATIKCGCGNVMEVGSTKETMTVETCSKCHPFYTGNQKSQISSSRVERFKQKYGIKD